MIVTRVFIAQKITDHLMAGNLKAPKKHTIKKKKLFSSEPDSLSTYLA